MNLFKISWKYLTFRPLSTGLNIFLLALGLAIITVLLLIQDQFEKKMNQFHLKMNQLERQIEDMKGGL